ncbi:hypothetical protein GCM10009872_26830 [Actinopolymorpha rutila]|nr:polysaccharide biosynthesis protein [Actinopolymorpha rutila]
MLGVSPAHILGRPAEPVYGEEATRLVAGRRVLVTGAGGSIGGEIVRQLSRLGVGELFFVDNDEYALYSLQRELSGTALLDDSHFVLADVADEAKLNRVFAWARPSIVYHAAAHKHLPLLENSPEAAVRTNVLGTAVVLQASIAHGVERFINISTDKAARPTSVLGMSKRLAEMVVADRAGSANPGTTVASVRFGNVLGSRGSFVETLSWQLATGRPVTLTHPAASRYFMTIPEAAGLVIEASVLAQAGETYVLDMGEPVRILDLIQRFAALSGAPEPRIVVTGLRPGEKLHEELFDPSEAQRPTAHPRIREVDVAENGAASWPAIRSLCARAATAHPDEVRRAMAELLAGADLAVLAS